MLSHYLNQRGVIVNWTHRNKPRWNFNQTTKLFLHENQSENIVCEWRPFCSGGDELIEEHHIDSLTPTKSLDVALYSSIMKYVYPHDDVIKWKQKPRYWPFVRGIHRSPVNSPHKGQWRGALMFSFICVWINGWVNNLKAGDLRRYCAHYDVTVINFSKRNLCWTAKLKNNITRHWSKIAQQFGLYSNRHLIRCLIKVEPRIFAMAFSVCYGLSWGKMEKVNRKILISPSVCYIHRGGWMWSLGMYTTLWPQPCINYTTNIQLKGNTLTLTKCCESYVNMTSFSFQYWKKTVNGLS